MPALRRESPVLQVLWDWVSSLTWACWVIVALVGQLVFGGRFLVQWIVSERKGESVIPVAFWHLSIVGSLIMLTYGLKRHDPVLIAGYALNSIVYVRNLMLLAKKAEDEKAKVAA